jgi:formiminotetrahydrofolate cyclodeaminase
MPSYTTLPVRDLLDAFASAMPAPGGGSAAALTGATGVSLLLMAAGIRLSKPGGSAHSPALEEARDRLQSLHPTITAFIDRDADAYSSVVEAIRVNGDLQEALRGATDIPLETMRACRNALQDAPIVATYCTKSTRGDVGVAIDLLNAAVRGAGLTIDANLGSIGDAEYVSRVRSERQRLESESAADAEHGLSRLSVRS